MMVIIWLMMVKNDLVGGFEPSPLKSMKVSWVTISNYPLLM